MTQDMTMNALHEENRFVRTLDKMDQLPDWSFFTILWLVRWPVVTLLMPVQYGLAILLYGTAEPEFLKDAMNVTATQQFVGGVILVPIFLIAFECAVLYLFFCRRPRRARPWWFIGLSALVMVVLSPIAAFPCAFATGLFLAYCYAHYAQVNMWKAYGFTVLFLALINLTGLVMMALGLFRM